MRDDVRRAAAAWALERPVNDRHVRGTATVLSAPVDPVQEALEDRPPAHDAALQVAVGGYWWRWEAMVLSWDSVSNC